MARTEVPYTNLVANAVVAAPAGTALNGGVGNGHIIERVDPELTVLFITNTDTDPHDVVLKAGTYPPAVAAGQGDVTFEIDGEDAGYFGPFDSSRHMQNDGSALIDIETGHTGTITALRVPRNT